MTPFAKRVSLMCAFTALILFSKDMIAQPPPGGGGGPGPGCWPPPCVPIDGGVGFLILAGLALGGWKIYTSYRKNLA